MDLGTIITGVVVVLIITVPFVLMGMNNNKREKRFVQGLFSLAEKNNYQVTRHDLWDNALIGIDEKNSKLFFIRKANGTEISKMENLAEIQQCRVINHSREVNHKDSKQKVTDQVALALAYQDKSKKETLLEFYNVDYDGFLLKGEVQLAEKWSKIINEAISAKTK